MNYTNKVPLPTGRTKSEGIFERFLTDNSVAFRRIQEESSSRPDYLVTVGDARLTFEVKEISEDENFGVIADPKHANIRSNSRTVGDHVRARIKGSRKQIQYGANQGLPSILLIYDSLDRVFQDFGTSDLDFTTAMYGELTLLMDKHSAPLPSYST